MPSSNRAAPPQLVFDDGSRIMNESSLDFSASFNQTNMNVSSSERGNIPLHEYYEIDSICNQIVKRLNLVNKHKQSERWKNLNTTHGSSSNLSFLCKIALQFPDELLPDADEVSWAIEEGIQQCYNQEISMLERENNSKSEIFLSPLVFVLGDTTYGSCCIDEVAALHLNADLIVHYGYACLSPTSNIPAIYSFGVTPMTNDEEIECVDKVFEEMNKKGTCGKEGKVSQKSLLILYNVGYHHSIPRIVEKLKLGGLNDVIIGKIPQYQFLQQKQRISSCCNDSQPNETNSSCCQTSSSSNFSNTTISENVLKDDEKCQTISQETSVYIGGLEVTLLNLESLSDYTLLYIGQVCRQMINVMLRCSGKDGTKECWSYTLPSTGTNTNGDNGSNQKERGKFSTDASSVCKRELNRRYYLTQKARMASIIGIVVGTLGVSRFQSVVSNLRTKIENSGRGCYIVVVGKINVAKLANFGEIDTFVLVACPENSMLDCRDFHVPVITPMEMEIALGEREWDGFYSTDFSDFLTNDCEIMEDQKKTNQTNTEKVEEEDDDDKPYFSLISGGYETDKKFVKKKELELSNVSCNSEIDLRALPGKGQMTAYNSEAAEFLKKREYQGLQTKVGETKVAPAVKGQMGIASDYGNR